MYRSCSFTEGMPPRIYRAPSEITRDISELRSSIASINERLNIRSLLLDILCEEDERRPEKVVPMLENALAEAEESLERLRELREELQSLEDELYEVRCEMGI